MRSLNALRDRLAAMDLSSVTAAEMRALKREELSAVGSVILHELYFLNLGGDGKIPAAVATALERTSVVSASGAASSSPPPSRWREGRAGSC